MSIPEFLVKNYDTEEEYFCSMVYPEEWMGTAYSWIWFLFSAFIPVSLMAVLYSRIVYALWFKRTESTEGNNNLQQV